MLALALFACVAFAQQTVVTLRGQVTDTSGAVIPGATVSVKGQGVSKNASTGADGAFVVPGLTAGKYTVRATSTGFAPYENKAVDVALQMQPLLIALNLPVTKEEVTVSGGPGVKLSTESDNNASALVLRGADLDALPDDPDDLAADLQALAGPSAGPNGGQIFVDGFTGGRLPPKESIREIRINQNPFCGRVRPARLRPHRDFDQAGHGQVPRPGLLQLRRQHLQHAQSVSCQRTALSSGSIGAAWAAPSASGLRSISISSARRSTTTRASTRRYSTPTEPGQLSQAVLTPAARTSFSPRLDYQLSKNNTLVMKYTFFRNGLDNIGVGTFDLASRGYNQLTDGHTFQATETAMIGAHVVNETRFQFMRTNLSDTGDNTLPAISVLQSFNGGGAQIGNSSNLQNHYELQNYTSVLRGTHTIKFGGRMRVSTQDDLSLQNFGGTFTFGGGPGPQLDANGNIIPGVIAPLTSLDVYRETLLLQQRGMTVTQIRTLGLGPSQFTIAGGIPLASVTQADIGAFFQDDWRVRPNLTLSMGLRYETQTNIHDWHDLGPRVSFAWAPGQATGKPTKTVFRGGFGMFYDRIDDNLSLNSFRFNSINPLQVSYIVPYPTFFSTTTVPSTSSLTGKQPLTVDQLASSLRAPYTMQAVGSVERSLPANSTISASYIWSRADHLLLTRNINAPIESLGGALPYGAAPGNIFEYESAGMLKQKQLMVNVNSRFNKNVQIFGYWMLGYARSDTDGSGTIPANQYDLASEWGRSSLDQRQRIFFGGSITAPKAIRLSPFIFWRTGQPYNVTSGRDLSNDGVFNDRPALVPTSAGLDPSRYRTTPLGTFDMNPGPGEPIIPRNFAEGPGYFSVSLRLSRTWGFGPTRGNYNATSDDHHHSDSGRGGSSGGSRGGGPPGGGMRMGGGSFHGGGEGITEHRYNLTLSISSRNLFNHVNAAPPIGNLTSPYFGESTASANSYGLERAQAGNRRLEFQLRFSF